MSNANVIHLIGIDPGLDGATVSIQPRTHQLGCIAHSAIARMEENKSYLNPGSYMEYAKRMSELIPSANKVVIIERPIGLGKQAGQMTVGINWGIVATVWKLLGYTLLIVPANVWKPVMVGRTLSKRYGKESSIIVATEKGYVVPPHANGGKKLHDGAADAILIAEYGGRKLNIL